MKTEAEEISDDDHDTSFDTTCNVCYAEFLDAEDLTIHIKQMHSTPANPKYCQFCPETYTDLLDYAAHVRDTHLMDMRSCVLCTKVFLDGAKLNAHEKKHLVSGATYSCSQCNAVFHEGILLELHERKNHDNDKDGCFLKCMPCLSSILCLKAVRLMQSVGKKKLKCSLCNFSSEKLEMYIKHLEAKKCKGYVCDKCSGLYKTRKNIIKHQNCKKCLSVNEYSDKATKMCKDCNSEVHPRAMHLHAKSCNPLKCVDCSNIFKSIDELSAHQIKKHPLDMTLIRCKFCLKEFIGKSPLKKHIDRVHKPVFHLFKYKCIDCDEIFQHPQKLFAHYFTRHKELQPFHCKICNKDFRVRKGFSLHIKLDHKSVGFVEFNDQYHVFFTDKKSEKPFIPDCVVPRELLDSEDSSGKKSKAFSIRSQDLLETDADATEVETEEDKPLKRKLPPKQIKSKRPKKTLKKDAVLIYSSDEEPLLEIRKRSLNKKKVRCNWTWKKNSVTKSKFTCQICKKNCYTYQNHQNHMSHHNEDQVECVKCSQKFNSKSDLTKHINTEHASSKLTETLRDLLKKKKRNMPGEPTFTAPKTGDKFRIAMKKVKMTKSVTPATIKPVETDLSVKNFLENFTPDVTDATAKKKVEIGSDVSITPYISPFYRESIIKLTKFKEEPMNKPISLKMPERFKQQDHYMKTKISVKLVQEPAHSYILPDYAEHNYFDSFQDDNDERNEIPEVAQEVSLEGTEEPPPNQIPTKIVIPKMPKGYSKIHIATLQSQAPYFKIIKVDSENLNEITTKEAPVTRSDVIDLPGGTKLVTANPFAHLLEGTSLNKIMEPVKNKYYKPVIKDFQGMLAQAMLKLEGPQPPRNRKPRAKKPKVPESDKIND